MKLGLDLKNIGFQKSTNDHLKFSSKIEYNQGNWGGGGKIEKFVPILWRDRVTFWVNLVKVSQKSFLNAFKKRSRFPAKG